MRLIDLSQTISPDMPLFSPSAPRPSISAWQSHAGSAASGRYVDCTCEISEAHFLTSIGTYLDSPYHFDPAGYSIERVALEQAVLPGIVVDCSFVQARQPIGPDVLEGLDLAGRAVLFHTGWSRYWGQQAYLEHPFLVRDTAVALCAAGARLAGVDFLVIDDTGNPRRPVHVTLLAQDVLIVENLTHLNQLPREGFVFHAAPAKVAGAAAFPIRAYAVVQA